MRAFWRGLVRILFWSYERGTWPYDVAVAMIVVFVLLSPRSWFQDQPQVGPPASTAKVVLLNVDEKNTLYTYDLDARLLAPPIRTPELEHQVHEALRRNVTSLGRSFQIVRIDPIHGQDGTITSYVVSIRP